MILIIIFAFTLLFMWGAMVFSYGMSSIENGKYLLGITLPKQYRKESDVPEILKSYQTGTRRIGLIGFLTGAAILLLNGYISILFALMMLWFGALQWFYQENVTKHARRLYELKIKNGWLVGNPHILRVDTVLSSIKDRGCVSVWWFLPAWAIGIAGCFWTTGTDKLREAGILAVTDNIHAVIFLFTELLFLLCWFGIHKAKPSVYCSDTAANQKIHRAVCFEWSRCMVIHGYGGAVTYWFVGWIWRLQASPAGMMIGVLLSLIGSVAVLYFAWHNAKEAKARVLESLAIENTQLYGDDDEYWLNGYPAGKVPTGLVEKRIGIGWTTNASLKANGPDKAVWIFIGLFTLGITLFLMPFDFARITMQIDWDAGNCRVEAASMGHTFALDEVEDVLWFEEYPSMSKRNGYDSNRFNLGDFRVSGYGNCKVYLSLQNESAILVQTEEKNIWFNSESPDETREFYEALLKAVEE